ncbi:LysR family transcriptional regulator [Amycolatopsis sp. QT-25]|uniref:LysR family transcriptional regulator n=1 Tax=Amycolatopsis sp. QT-25 TaxID=3034022 RepID=UPI0023ED6E3A|nr:LysR family transcriptional regulator [Amycolatopsis sp. QT-25]WET82560.1 LysR family transcriptional regulator [Amycolatopsis sp. QT-25]
MELREIECFLVLAEEMHFRRTAERLHLSPARVSQTIRLLERRVGATLFERTSRRVRLTALGKSFHQEVRPVFQELHRVFDRVTAAAREVDGVLRLGFLGSAANELTADILGRFRDRYPGCQVTMSEVHCADPLGPLRSDDVDVLITRLPVHEDDLTVGPILLSERRVLAVPPGHRFSRRVSISVEDLAEETLVDVAGPAPEYWWEFHAPARTPSGRRIPRGPAVATFQELLAQIGAGSGVSPVVESVSRYYARPDVSLVPIRDMPHSEVALVWRAGAETALLTAFADVATEAAAQARRQRVRTNA